VLGDKRGTCSRSSEVEVREEEKEEKGGEGKKEETERKEGKGEANHIGNFVQGQQATTASSRDVKAN